MELLCERQTVNQIYVPTHRLRMVIGGKNEVIKTCLQKRASAQPPSSVKARTL